MADHSCCRPHVWWVTSTSKSGSCGKCFWLVSTLTYFYMVRKTGQIFNLSRIPSLCTQPSFYHLEMRCRSLGEVVAWKSWSPGWDHKGCINWMWTRLMSTSSSKPPLLCWEFEGTGVHKTLSQNDETSKATPKSSLLYSTAWACLRTSNPILSCGLCHTFWLLFMFGGCFWKKPNGMLVDFSLWH